MAIFINILLDVFSHAWDKQYEKSEYWILKKRDKGSMAFLYLITDSFETENSERDETITKLPDNSWIPAHSNS